MATTTTTEEHTLTLADGLEVYAKTWKPAGPPVAHVLFLHGYSEHCNAYYGFPPAMAAAGVEFFSFDQRGWGRTARDKKQRGVTGPTAQLLADIDELLQRRLDAHPGLPLFLLGHSMGGGAALTYAHGGSLRGRLAGVAVWSPLIELAAAIRPSWLLLTGGRLVARLLPNLQRVEALNVAAMSRDPAARADLARDPLSHGTGTLLGISEALARGELLDRADTARAFPPDLPVLVCHGSADTVTDCAASCRFVAALAGADKAFREYAGWLHKLHAEPEPDRTRFAADMVEWILERAGGTSSHML